MTIPATTIAEAFALRKRGLSYRQIESALQHRIGRGALAYYLLAQAPPTETTTPDDLNIPTPDHCRRCPRCHRLVTMPCLACKAEKARNEARAQPDRTPRIERQFAKARDLPLIKRIRAAKRARRNHSTSEDVLY